jgi:predicted ATP-dependent endonuclease of OLD family
MKIRTVKVHNFRSILDVTFNLADYGLLIGANNAGKSNLIDALRVFYDDWKYNKERDFPKHNTSDNQSWIEIDFELTIVEYSNLADEYKIQPNQLRVRKYLEKADPYNAGIYGYTSTGLATSYFYGAKNIQQGKFGEVIYIPAVSRIDEVTKLSGPSTLRSLLNNILGKLAIASPAFKVLTDSFIAFSSAIKAEQTDDTQSIETLETEINSGIAEWGMKFSLNVNPISPQDVVKNLVSLEVTDGSYGGQLEADQFGHGFQRHLIFILLQLSAKYKPVQLAPERKEFLPSLTVLLFEEPEAFLHPPQQLILYKSLSEISKQPGNQVVVTTHSPYFVSQSSDDLDELVRVRREVGKTTIGQLSKNDLGNIFKDNQAINQIFQNNANYSHPTPDSEILDVQIEDIQYLMWLDSERCHMFFAQHVLIVEGLSERILINHLIKEGMIQTPRGGVYILDCASKYNIHRFMNLLNELGIPHSVLHDQDRGRFQNEINQLIQNAKGNYTRKIHAFPDELESFLGIQKNNDQKPQRLMLRLVKGEIPPTNLQSLINLIETLIN